MILFMPKRARSQWRRRSRITHYQPSRSSSLPFPRRLLHPSPSPLRSPLGRFAFASASALPSLAVVSARVCSAAARFPVAALAAHVPLFPPPHPHPALQQYASERTLVASAATLPPFPFPAPLPSAHPHHRPLLLCSLSSLLLPYVRRPPCFPG
ncbi:hypothetical protein OH77DRAFT_947685 [Trametes cingulata]|nr:hypothetical protein OH77DRAFT_947685 [Trametes cingulata]